MADFTIATLKDPLTETQALEKELDARPALRNLHNFEEFRNRLHLRRHQIESLCSQHLGVPLTDLTLSPTSEWIRGTFNLCAVLHINQNRRTKRLPRRALMRFPLPFSVGEDFDPGSVGEKLRCEAATYIYLASTCPSVPIPGLLGMGYPGKQSFSAVENVSLWKWAIWQLRRSIAWLQGKTITPYFGFHRTCLADTGYLLLEYVEHGEMLSYTWQLYHNDERRRINLFRGLARVMLDLAKQPQPRIGSWTMNDSGGISLTNRPLSDLTCFWNAYHIPSTVPRDLTYTCADTFIHDMLRLQDNRMRYQPNSILNKEDGIFQLSSLVGLRALAPRFWDQRSRHGPFIMTLPDMHQSNIFVDNDWNVTRLIDLEFAPVYPVQFVDVPHWISGRGVDQLSDGHLQDYKVLYDEFLGIMEREEAAREQGHSLSQGLGEAWTTGRHWHNMALGSVNAFPGIYQQHLQPRFFKEFTQADEPILAQLWDEDVYTFLDRKQTHLDDYEEELRKIFATARICATAASPIGEGDGGTDVG